MKTELEVRHPAYVGGLLFLVTAPIHLFVTHEVSVVVAAVTLSLIAGAYIGFGAQANNLQTMLTELLVACFFGLVALAGLLWHWGAIPFGLAMHALWDLLHHRPTFGARVPHWYIPFCVVYDLAAALFFVVLYAI